MYFLIRIVKTQTARPPDFLDDEELQNDLGDILESGAPMANAALQVPSPRSN